MTALHQSPWSFDFERMEKSIEAIQIRTQSNTEELPTHRHHQGQLALVLEGMMTCEVPGALWIAPVHGGLWIPGGTPHSNRVTAHARVCFVFVTRDVPGMPSACCALGVTPLTRELILHLANLPANKTEVSQNDRVRAVLIDQLAGMAREPLHLPVSDDSRIRRMVEAMMRDPSVRTTALEWAERFAMSERSFTRLIQSETGMSFGRWRQRLHLILALQWLSSGVSVQRVAGDLGYGSVSAFIAMFRQSMGKSPKRYLSERRFGAKS